jgi:hypothetical protein
LVQVLVQVLVLQVLTVAGVVVVILLMQEAVTRVLVVRAVAVMRLATLILLQAAQRL